MEKAQIETSETETPETETIDPHALHENIRRARFAADLLPEADFRLADCCHNEAQRPFAHLHFQHRRL
jgi:hypothetical protein